MSVEIVGTFQEDIIKAFQGLLNPKQIQTLVQMHEETRMLQLAVSDLHRQNVQLVELMQLNQQVNQHYKEQFAKFEKKFGDQQNEFIRSEDAKE